MTETERQDKIWERFILITGCIGVTLPVIIISATSKRWAESNWPWLVVVFILIVVLAGRSIQRGERIRQLEQRCLHLERAVYLLVGTHQNNEMHATVLSKGDSWSSGWDRTEEANHIAQALSDMPFRFRP